MKTWVAPWRASFHGRPPSTTDERRTIPAAVFALVLALCGDAGAGPPTEAIRETLTAVNRVLDDPALQGRPTELLAKVRNVVSTRFDFREAAQRALGREWQARAPAEREEFVRLFADLLERSYISRIASRASVRGGLTVRYLGESVDGNVATVTTTIASRAGGELPVEYQMIAFDERWAVYDIRVDGISIVDNYRAQFARILRQSSYRDLVAQVTGRASEASSDSTAAREDGASASIADELPPLGYRRASDGGAPTPRPRPARTTEATAPPAEAPRAEGSAPTVGRARTVDLSPDKRSEGQPRAAEPEPARAVPPARIAVVPAASYWIQVGAFRNPDAASGLAARLLERNLPVAIDSVARSRDHRDLLLSRVRVGPFADPAELESKLRALRQVGYQPFIAREPD